MEAASNKMEEWEEWNARDEDDVETEEKWLNCTDIAGEDHLNLLDGIRLSQVLQNGQGLRRFVNMCRGHLCAYSDADKARQKELFKGMEKMYTNGGLNPLPELLSEILRAKECCSYSSSNNNNNEESSEVRYEQPIMNNVEHLWAQEDGKNINNSDGYVNVGVEEQEEEDEDDVEGEDGTGYQSLDQYENLWGRRIAKQAESLYASLCSQPATPIEGGIVPYQYFDFWDRCHQRNSSLRELIDTEINYVKNLEAIIHFRDNVLEQHVCAKHLRKIFRNIHQINEVNRQFLAALVDIFCRSLPLFVAERCPPIVAVQLSQAFIGFKKDFAAAYASYVSKRGESMALLAWMERTRPKLKRILQSEATYRKALVDDTDALRHFALATFLWLPAKRIADYRQLFERMVKEMEQKANVEEKICVTNAFNAATGDRRKVLTIRAIESCLTWAPTLEKKKLQEQGRLLAEAVLKVTFARANGLEPNNNQHQQQHEFHVFLFERLLLFAEEKGYGYTIKCCIWVENLNFPPSTTVGNNNAHSTLLGKLKKHVPFEQHQQQQRTFSLVVTSDNNVNIGADTLLFSTEAEFLLLLEFTSKAQLQKWQKRLHKAINRNPWTHQHIGHATIYTTYTSPTNCSICGKFLCGLMFQGLHCKICAKDMHPICAFNSSKSLRRCLPMSVQAKTRQLSGVKSNLDVHPISSFGSTKFEDQDFYFGAITKEQANKLLEGTPKGTFIARQRERCPSSSSVDKINDNWSFSISLSYDGAVKHLKILVDEKTQKYKLSQQRSFDTPMELIVYYRKNSLRECFNLNTPLRGTLIKNTQF